MFGIKTMLVGGGAAAVLWAMNSHASAGDVVTNVQNGLGSFSGVKTDNSSSGGGLGGAAASIVPASARPGQSVTITVSSCIQSTSGTASMKWFANNGVVALSRDPKGAGLSGTGQI